MNNINNFLEELTQLSQKYNIYIGGCGCCGSPWIDDKNNGECYDNLQYDENKKIYTVNIE